MSKENKEVPLIVKAISIIRDKHAAIAQELTELLKQQVPQEFKDKPVSAMPNFDPEDLMKHDWKGKRIGQGQYSEGSLSWGWDFRDKFKPETIKVLEQDSILTIGEYEFTLLENIVQSKKIKEG
jgi:hypothetical protein